MRALEAEIDSAARSMAKVLITGETGVGKEVVARLIHERSSRARLRMVTLNCAGLPDSLLESELFGHVKGSFTGAYRDKPGLLETAPGGTVFLDEVGEMTTRMQAVLLRFLETGEIQRVGADQAHVRVDVRLITATNRNLEADVAAGTFREDLFFRLNVIRLHIPPLRERQDDVPALLEHYLTSYSQQHRVAAPQFSEPALQALGAYRWPGNIRELKNVVERLVVRHSGSMLSPADLPAEIAGPSRPVPTRGTTPEHAVRPSAADALAAAMLEHGESFWSAVYPTFMARDLTRADLRQIVHIGLQHTRGNYRLLVERFNMPAADYKRFLAFLRKHNCHLPFQQFRAVSENAAPDSPPLRAVSGGNR